MKTASTFWALAALAVAAARLQGQSSDLFAFSNLVGDYNAISIGNAQLSLNSQDVEGPIAVGGNLALGGDPLVILSQFDNSSDPDLYVGGTFSIDNNATVQLDNGYAALPGNVGNGTYPYQGNNTRYQPNGTTGWLQVNSSVAHSNTDPRSNPTGRWATTSMSSLQSQLTTLSQNLATFSATGTLAVSNNNLTFTGAATGITVFTLNAAQLTQSGNNALYNGTLFNQIVMNIPNGAFYIVNVTNASSDSNPIFGPGVNFNGSTTMASKLLWNLEGSGNVTLGNNGQFYGSVLAPQINLSNGTNDPLTGQIVAATLNYQNAELHDAMLIPIPEPEYWVLIAGALAFGSVTLRRAFHVKFSLP